MQRHKMQIANTGLKMNKVRKLILFNFSSVQFSSVAQSCPTERLNLTINLAGASKPATRRNLLTATGGITANVAGWTVNDADGIVVRKARINLDGTNLTLALDAGTVIILK